MENKTTMTMTILIAIIVSSVLIGMTVHMVFGINNSTTKNAIAVAKSNITSVINKFVNQHNLTKFENTTTMTKGLGNISHITTPYEIMKMENDAANYIKTHKNNENSNSSKNIYKHGSEIQIPLNHYNYTLSNGSKY